MGYRPWGSKELGTTEQLTLPPASGGTQGAGCAAGLSSCPVTVSEDALLAPAPARR